MAEGEKIKVVQRHGILGAGLWLDIDVNTVYGCVQWGLIPYIKIRRTSASAGRKSKTFLRRTPIAPSGRASSNSAAGTTTRASAACSPNRKNPKLAGQAHRPAFRISARSARLVSGFRSELPLDADGNCDECTG